MAPDDDRKRRLRDMLARHEQHRDDPRERLPSRFRFLRELGRGGMGLVVAAQDEELGRPVAIKMTRWAEEGEEELRARFLREGQALAAIRHPGVVRVHEVVNDELLVMELIEGPSLRDRLKANGPLPAEEVRRLGVELAEALAHVHERGIIHRDLKPANVVFDEGGKAKLVDFGVTRRLDQSTHLSVSGEVIGTPGFLAPEQVRGHEVDERTDVYGLGATLYAAASGRSPCPPRGPGADAVLRAVLETSPPALTELVPAAPASLSQALKRCLAKDPARRYPNAAAFAVELNTQRAATPTPRIALGLVLLIGLIGVLAWTLVPPLPAPPPLAPNRPVEPKAASEQETEALPRRPTVLAELAEYDLGFLGSQPAGWRLQDVRLWTRSGEPQGEPIPVRDPLDVSFSPRGTRIAVGYSDRLLLIDPASGEHVRVKIPAARVAHSISGLVAAGFEDRVRLVDETSGEVTKAWVAQHRLVDLEFSPDGQWLAAIYGGMNENLGHAIVFRTHDASRAASWVLGSSPRCMVFGPKGRLFIGDVHGGVRGFDPRRPTADPLVLRRDFKTIGKPRAHFDDVATMAFLGDRLLTASKDSVSGDLKKVKPNDMVLWDLETGRSTVLLGGPGLRFHSIAASPDGSLVLVTEVRPRMTQIVLYPAEHLLLSADSR